MFSKLKNGITSFGLWAQVHWLALVIFMVIIMLLFLCLVLCSWLIGYWANALYGTKFELSSCWTGVGVVITGLGGVAALAKAAWTKYGIDGEFNTLPGQGMAPIINNIIKNDTGGR